MTRVRPCSPGAWNERAPITVSGETARCLTWSPSTTVTPRCVQATCTGPDGTTGLPPVSGAGGAAALSDADLCTTVAAAGAASRRRQAPASAAVRGVRPRGLLSGRMELDPPVLGRARVEARQGRALALAPDQQQLGGNAEAAREVAADRGGAALGEDLVVAFAAERVGVADDQDALAPGLRQPEHLADAVEVGAGLGQQLSRVEREADREAERVGVTRQRPGRRLGGGRLRPGRDRLRGRRRRDDRPRHRGGLGRGLGAEADAAGAAVLAAVRGRSRPEYLRELGRLGNGPVEDRDLAGGGRGGGEQAADEAGEAAEAGGGGGGGPPGAPPGGGGSWG